jgi:hypothetical protein
MNQIFLRVQDMDSKISSAAVKAYDLSKLRENPKRSRIGGSRISGSQSSNLSEASIRENLQLFLCPIDFYLMEDPWVTPCGHTF